MEKLKKEMNSVTGERREGAVQAYSLGIDWAYNGTYTSSKSLDFGLCLFIYAHVNC